MTYTKEKEVTPITPEQTFDDINNTINYNTSRPEYICPKHWNEWKNSGVSDTIICRNIRTVEDPCIVDRLLNRNTKERWKHSKELVPAWAVTGEDPLTGMPTDDGCQIKPDTPVMRANGKIQKYLSPSEYLLSPLFLSTDTEGFWQAIMADKSIPIIITEGAKKAGAGMSIGYAVISIPGVSTCKKDGRLHELIKLFTGFGRTIYLCFDNDIVVKKPVQNAMTSLAKEIAATGSKVMVINLPPGDDKGMDDFIFHRGKEAFDQLFENAQTIEEWRKALEEQWLKQQLEEGEETKCKLKRQFEIIRDGWGEGLRLNQMKNQIELGGRGLDLDQIRLHMVLEFGETVPIGDAQAIVQMLAGNNAYHPVNDYLENVAAQYPDVDISILDNLATRYFGSSNELHNIYMKKTLLAAVARIVEPGCRVETVTILVNPNQGIGKSTFWRNLFGENWFSDDMGDANEKDERMKLHNFWCLEWSEFENVYKRKDIGALKKFITTKTDSFRTPYSRTVKEYPRRSVLVGTTNEQEILADPTGDRRFWVIPVSGSIPVERLFKERDELWAAAYALYKTGEKWFLTSEQEQQRLELNKQFQVVDPWSQKIQEYVEFKTEVTLPELFKHLEIETVRQDIGLSKRIGAVLTRIGWESERKRSGGCWVRTWTKKNQKVEKVTGSSGSTGSAFEAVAHDTSDNLSETNQVNGVTQDTSKNDTSISGIRDVGHTQQELQPTISNADPVDPVTFSTFQKNNFVQSEAIAKLVDHTVEEGKFYYSLSLKKEVRVINVYPKVKEAQVMVAGDIEEPRLPWLDLQPLPPKFLKHDEVEVLSGMYQGRILRVDFFHDGGYWLRDPHSKKKPTVGFGPFEVEQLKLLPRQK